MGSFVYRAYDATGATKEGEIAALNEYSARIKLKELGLIPVDIKIIAASSQKWTDRLQFRKTPKLNDIELLTSKMAMLLNNGVKVDRALEIVKKGVSSRLVEKLIDGIYDDIRRGMRLSQAIEKYPGSFDALFVSVVRIGEATGQLGSAFNDLAANLSFRKSIRHKTLEALFYPGFIFVLCCLAVFFMFDYIVPKLAVVFVGMKDLPFYTTALLTASDLVQEYQLILPVIIVILIFLIKKVRKREWFVRVYDRIVLLLPVVSRMYMTLENLRFVSSLAILLKNRVVLSDALAYAVKSIGNVMIRNQLIIVKNEVRQGGKLSVAISKTGLLSGEFDGLIEIGEQTGNLAGIFREMEIRLKMDYENSVAGLIKIIEPVMIMIMGAIVGTVVIIMLLSIVSMNELNF